MDVYARLPTELAQKYDNLKEALLKRYALTEEGYKQKFYGSKADSGESPQQLINRMNSYLNRWVELSGIDKTYEGLVNLMVREQYLNTCPKLLEIFLRERAFTNLTELAKLAEHYEDAHASNLKREVKRSEKGVE